MALQQKKQVVPYSLTGDEFLSADVVMKRSACKTYPVSGSNYQSNANREINFRISSEHFADLSALTLFLKLKIHDPNLTLDDLHSSLIERVVTSLNGTVVEDLDKVNRIHKVMTYAHCPKAYYEHEMHATEGAYKYVRSIQKDGKYAENDFNLNAGGNASRSSNFYTGDQSGNNYISINLGLLLGICRGYNGATKLFPLRNFSELMISITLAPAVDACVSYVSGRTSGSTSTPPTTLVQSYECNNPFLMYTAVQLDPRYYAQFEQMLMSDIGYTSFYDSYHCFEKQIPSTIGVHNIALTLSRSDVRALYCVFQPTAMLSRDKMHFSKSNFFLGDKFRSAALTYGSEVVPACRIESTAEAFYHLRSTLNRHGSVISGSVIDADEYQGVSRKQLRGVEYNAYMHASNGKLDTLKYDNPCDYQASCFILAFPLSKCYDSSATMQLGLDSLSTAHHLTLDLDFTATPLSVTFDDQVDGDSTTVGSIAGVSEDMCTNLTNWTMTVIADTSRVLRYRQGAVTAHV